VTPTPLVVRTAVHTAHHLCPATCTLAGCATMRMHQQQQDFLTMYHVFAMMLQKEL
jgi:hypothetical protein